MKLIRRILRYMLLLAFVVVLWLAYYYRAVIFSEVINTYVDDTIHSALVMANIVPEQADPTTEEVEPKPDCETPKEVAQITEADVETCECEVEDTQAQSVVESDIDQVTDEEPAQTDEGPAQTETEELAIETDVESEKSVTAPLPLIEDVGELAATTQEQVEEQAPEQVEEQALDQVEEQATEQATEQPAVEATTDNTVARGPGQEAPKSHFELINQARFVYQTGNDNMAVDLYRELGELYPDDPNAYGELGNVFYSKGEWKQASLAYYEAALRLNKQRRIEQIHYLYRVIHGLDPETAEKLRNQLES